MIQGNTDLLLFPSCLSGNCYFEKRKSALLIVNPIDVCVSALNHLVLMFQVRVPVKALQEEVQTQVEVTLKEIKVTLAQTFQVGSSNSSKYKTKQATPIVFNFAYWIESVNKYKLVLVFLYHKNVHEKEKTI